MGAVTVTTDAGYRTRIVTRDQVWFADEPVESGGTNSGPTPIEMLKGALGACIVITVELYAQRKNWPLEKVEVVIDLERFNASEYPGHEGGGAFVHEIREKVTLHGDQLTDDQRARLMEIATKCPVRRVLANPTVFVESEHTLATD